MQKVMVGMSGGVDSSVAAALLKDRGYAVCGATLKLFDAGDITEKNAHTCCALSDVEDARLVAYKMGIDHFVFNFGDAFRKSVMDKFVAEYVNGRTPNPCIDCNRYIKFSKMLQRALELHCDAIATGHYARIEYNESTGRYCLKKAKDSNKDQTYVLYSLTQFALAHILFPLGDYTKEDVRRIAEEKGLVNARKPDSQDICFVPDGKYADFICHTTDKLPTPGDFIDTNGKVLGTHGGIIQYTIGQRKGLGITFGEPRYVVKKDAALNTVTLGTHAALFSDTLLASDVNWISIEALNAPMRVHAKTRYSQKEAPATISPNGDGTVRVVFDEKQRAISPGQAVVFYDGDYVVGGGTIYETL